MICIKCGFDNPGENTSCRVCGAPLGGHSVSVAETGAAVTTAATSKSATPDYSKTSVDCPNHPGVANGVVCDVCYASFCKDCIGALSPSGFMACLPCRREVLLRAEFCPDCSVDIDFVDNVDSYYEFSFFLNFLGKSEPCPKCNSVVRTRWFGSILPLGPFVLPFLPFFKDSPWGVRVAIPFLLSITHIPIVPIGSYRDREGAVIDEVEDQIHPTNQRARVGFRGGQAFRTAMIWLVSFAIIIVAIIIGVALNK